MNAASLDMKSLIEGAFDPSMVTEVAGRVALTPTSPRDALRAVNLALEHRLKICPIGNGSCLDMGSLPDDVLIVRTTLLSEVVEYAPDDLFIIVQTGMKLSDVAKHIKDPHLDLPFSRCGYPGTVGGALGMGIEIDLGGERHNIRQAVSSVEFVTPYGRLITTGALTIKSVAGYDVARFLAGSRGCFGIVTSVAFRLSSSPERTPITPTLASELPRVSPTWEHPAVGMKTDPATFLKENLDPSGIFPMP